MLQRIELAENEKFDSSCYDMSERIDSIKGAIKNNHLEGDVSVKYQDDNSEIVGTAHQSLFHGKVFLKDTLGFTQAIGNYENGM